MTVSTVNQNAAESLADPEEYPNLFGDWQVALGVESKVVDTRSNYPPAVEYLNLSNRSNANLVEAFKNMQMDEEETLENGGSNYEGPGNVNVLNASMLCIKLMLWTYGVLQGAVDVNTDANPSAEGGGEDEGVNDQAQKVVDIVQWTPSCIFLIGNCLSCSLIFYLVSQAPVLRKYLAR
ncbi:hypothetical protein AgCh_039446 [Apium graveolens]